MPRKKYPIWDKREVLFYIFADTPPSADVMYTKFGTAGVFPISLGRPIQIFVRLVVGLGFQNPL